MKVRHLIFFFLLTLFSGCAELLNVLQSPAGVPLTEDEVISGLKEALSLGAKTSAEKLSMENGYYGDAAIRILLPDEAKIIMDNIYLRNNFYVNGASTYVQAVKHKNKPTYATLFHPEARNKDLIENFLYL